MHTTDLLVFETDFSEAKLILKSWKCVNYIPRSTNSFIPFLKRKNYSTYLQKWW